MFISSDCVSRQAAIDVLDALDITDGVGISSIACDLQEEAICGIQNLPSLQPENIRCKDCKYYETMYCKMDVWTDDMRIYKAKPNDYCSYAERRTDGSD